MNPFDGPPTTPPVSFDPPPAPPRRRARMVGVVLATTGLLGAGVLGVSALVSADDDPALGSAPTTTGDDTTGDDTTGDEEPTDDTTTGEEPSTEDGPTLRIDDGEGDPFVVDLGELDADDLRRFTECAGVPMFGRDMLGEDMPGEDVFGEFDIFSDLPPGGEAGPMLDELLESWLQELEDARTDAPTDEGSSGDEGAPGDDLGPLLDELLGESAAGGELGPLLDQLLGELAADGELGAWLDQLLREASAAGDPTDDTTDDTTTDDTTDDTTDESTGTAPTDDELGALLEELLAGLGDGLGDDGALADRLEELLGDGELGGWFGGPGGPGGPFPGPARGGMHLGDDGTVTVLGPDGPAWIDLGDGDGSVTITRDGETGELTITTDGTAEEVDIDDLLADLPMVGSGGQFELPDPGTLQDCLDQLDDD